MAANPGKTGHPNQVERLQVWVNVVTAYEKVRFELTCSRLEVSWPVTVLGVVPTRRAALSVALEDLRSVRLRMVAFPSRLIVVCVMVSLAVFVHLPVVVSAGCFVAAIFFFLLSIVAAVEIT